MPEIKADRLNGTLFNVIRSADLQEAVLLFFCDVSIQKRSDSKQICQIEHSQHLLCSLSDQEDIHTCYSLPFM